jgi:hypothetical protein
MDPTPPPVRVNRAPFLTPWATVLAERLGYPFFCLTSWPICNAARSRSTVLVIIDCHSAIVTPSIAYGTSAHSITLSV